VARLNHGLLWVSIFDGQPLQAIGSLAASTSSDNIVWAGTGEAWAIRDVPAYNESISESGLAPPEYPLDTPASLC
jgi:hypothetical protein